MGHYRHGKEQTFQCLQYSVNLSRLAIIFMLPVQLDRIQLWSCLKSRDFWVNGSLNLYHACAACNHDNHVDLHVFGFPRKPHEPQTYMYFVVKN